MTTQSIRVSQSSDDAEQFETDAGGNIGSSALNIGQQEYVGLRFQGLNAPQGADITNAKLTWTAFGADSQNVNVIVYAQKADSAGTFSTATNDILNRLLSDASVSFTLTSSDAWSTEREYVWSGLEALIEEVTERPGWSDGNSIVLIIKDDGSSSQRRAKAYDSSSSEAPLLTVTWTDPTLMVSADAGSFSTSGNGSAVTPGAVTVSANVGSFSTTGYGSTVTENIVVAASTGSYATTGNASTLKTEPIVVVAALGTYVTAGNQSTISYGIEHEFPEAIVGGGAIVHIFA